MDHGADLERCARGISWYDAVDRSWCCWPVLCLLEGRVGCAGLVWAPRTKENKRKQKKKEKKKRKKAEGPAPEAKRLSANFDPPKLLVLILFSFALPTSK